jgi:hypothetical protein
MSSVCAFVRVQKGGRGRTCVHVLEANLERIVVSSTAKIHLTKNAIIVTECPWTLHTNTTHASEQFGRHSQATMPKMTGLAKAKAGL